MPARPQDTVEQRILELNAQKAKTAASKNGGSAAMAELVASKKGKGKILAGEIAGAIRDDRQELRAAELELLFS